MRNADKSRVEIECLTKLHQLSSVRDDILHFLREDSLISQEDIKSIKSLPEGDRLLYSLLMRLKKEARLQLVEFEWSLLPIERIKLTLVSERSSKEFTHN